MVGVLGEQLVERLVAHAQGLGVRAVEIHELALLGSQQQLADGPSTTELGGLTCNRATGETTRDPSPSTYSARSS